MAFFGRATSPILLFIPAFFCLSMAFACIGMAGGLGDALQKERVYVRRRLFLWTMLASAVALGIVNAATPSREIMDFVRWKRVLLRGVRLLTVGLSAVSYFILLDSAAGILLHLRVGDDSTAASSACAVVAIALHLCVGWMAVFDD